MHDPFTGILLVTLIFYLIGIFAISIWARARIASVEDFLVAGRRLPVSLATLTLLATWFGAGPVLTVSNEVWEGGLSRSALDPLGAGACLLIVGVFYAAPLWRRKLLTVSDFFRQRFGERAEVVSAAILVPSFFGWIAMQFVAVAGVLNLFFELPIWIGIALTATAGTAYTLIGGMWSVTLTDAIQMALVIIGLFLLGGVVFGTLGDGSIIAGLGVVREGTAPENWNIVASGSGEELLGWLSVFAAGALGLIPGQDLMQRVFSSKSAGVARGACILAGISYLALGAIPLLVAVAAHMVLPDFAGGSVLMAMANHFLSPALLVVFVVALLSAVLSTIDSAILSPAGVLAQNLLAKLHSLQGISGLSLNRWSVLIVALLSLTVAYLGESAYSLLEGAYEMTLVGLLVPLTIGLFSRTGGSAAAIVAMVTGTGVWAAHLLLRWDAFLMPLLDVSFPPALAATAISAVAYGAVCVPDLLRVERAIQQ